MVSVSSVIGIMNGTALSQTLNPSKEFTPPTSTPQPPLKLQLVKHYPITPKPSVAPQKTAQQLPKPEYAPAQPIRLNDLGGRLHLPGKLLSSLFEAEGVSIVSPNQILQPAEVEKVVRRICPNLGMAGFKKLYSARITVKEMANHFGRRPVELARDLSTNNVQPKPNDVVPYESVVRLCFHYRKLLPN